MEGCDFGANAEVAGSWESGIQNTYPERAEARQLIVLKNAETLRKCLRKFYGFYQ